MGPIWPVFILPFTRKGRQLLGEIFGVSGGSPKFDDPPEYSGHGTAAISVCPFCGVENGVKDEVVFTYFCKGCGADVSSHAMNNLRRWRAGQSCSDGL